MLLSTRLILFFSSKWVITAAFTYFPIHQTATFMLRMAVTPVGPFCPFRSTAAIDIEPRMEQIQTATPEFALEMSRLQLDMQMGNTPDRDRMRHLAQGIDVAVDDWENLLTRLRLSQDFQTLEYAKLTQAHLEKHGQTPAAIASMMRWPITAKM